MCWYLRRGGSQLETGSNSVVSSRRPSASARITIFPDSPRGRTTNKHAPWNGVVVRLLGARHVLRIASLLRWGFNLHAAGRQVEALDVLAVHAS